MDEHEPQQDDADLGAVPVFPLPGVVLFPRAILPLHVFEPRYRAMLRDALASSRLLVLAGTREDPPYEEVPAMPRVCGLGRIVQHQQLPDGRSNILVAGLARVVIEELPFVAPYRRVRASVLETEERSIPDADRTTLLSAATTFTGVARRVNPELKFRVPAELDARTLTDLCAHHLVVDAEVRQALLEELDPRRRLDQLVSQLVLQTRLLVTGPTAAPN